MVLTEPRANIQASWIFHLVKKQNKLRHRGFVSPAHCVFCQCQFHGHKKQEKKPEDQTQEYNQLQTEDSVSSPVLIAAVLGLLCLLEVSGRCRCQRCCALILKLCGNSLQAGVKGYHHYTHSQAGLESIVMKPQQTYESWTFLTPALHVGYTAQPSYVLTLTDIHTVHSKQPFRRSRAG